MEVRRFTDEKWRRKVGGPAWLTLGHHAYQSPSGHPLFDRLFCTVPSEVFSLSSSAPCLSECQGCLETSFFPYLFILVPRWCTYHFLVDFNTLRYISTSWNHPSTWIMNLESISQFKRSYDQSQGN